VEIRRKYWKPKLNDLCPCGSGGKYKGCCWNRLPGFDIGKAYTAACKDKKFGRATVAARADITQYTIWHRTNTAPMLHIGEPIEPLLRIDVNALREYVDRLSWLYYNNGKWTVWPATLERLSANIDHEWWQKKIIYQRAVMHLAPGGSRSKARQELARLGPITPAEDDIEILQIFIDLELRNASFSERTAFFERLLDLDESPESQIQYRGGKAIDLLLHGDPKAAKTQLRDLLDEYRNDDVLSPFARQKIYDVQETLGAITDDDVLLRETAAELSAEMQDDIWTDQGRSNLYFQMGDCYRYAREWELSIGAYEAAIVLNGGPLCQIHLAECLLYQREIGKAVRQIEGVPIEDLDEPGMMDFIFTYSAVSIWSEKVEMLEKARCWLKALEASEPLFNARRLDLLVRVTETAAKGTATTEAKEDSAPEGGVAGASRALLLQPNFFGIGINLNEIIERFSARKKKTQLAIEHHDTLDEEADDDKT
jgi:tetratricopeptide (TPR) repeat protein